MSELLNYKIEGEGHTIVLIHGLFGNLDNLGTLARDLKDDYQVVSLDLRNHGRSFHSDTHNYQVLAQDANHTLNYLGLENYSLIGHSMGGKAAMALADIARDQVRELIVLDMAPVRYQQRRHDNVLAGLNAVLAAKPVSRSEAMKVLAQHIEIDGVRQFLSKSLYKDGEHLSWRFNVPALENNYDHIQNWQEITPIDIPTLFIKGGDSDYLLAEHQMQIQRQFSRAKAHVIANTGHWLHAEKPFEVIRTIRKFIA
ncbi:alpha/beta fold hydrolase [Vibrio profundum]|uniref:alpha/beta fold hydrolase n=1 Tax=Vibrio profundum TaxID=2910247 RepID=UPI003D0CC46F